MKGDFTRDTFHPEKHFRQVLMQQGRVQLDADWNEQAALAARRAETATADLAGDCGGPADGAAFGAITSLADLTKVPSPVAGWFNALSADEQTSLTAALANGDFLLSPGRYYVDGIQCELEQPVLFSQQADLPGAAPVANGASLLYLDVWQRHLTALEMPALLDAALGGVDTATRAKTVWQVRSLALSGGIPSGACAADIPEYNSKTAPSTVRLKAQTQEQPNADDPCQVPETVGYKGLENQLYRVEIHEVNNDSTAKNWKWSRENGSITARLVKLDAAKKELTVESLGRNTAPDFGEQQFVELLDDTIELNSGPGELIEIDHVREADQVIVLKDKPTGTYKGTNPKVRRWDGFAKAKAGRLPLEAGIEIQFDDLTARCRTGDYWQIPARAATATSAGGDIEWPRNPNAQGQPDPTNPLALLPRGVVHHYCRLGFIVKSGGAASQFTDCRCLWPALTAVPRLFYVSGDGQEVMPDLTPPPGRVFKLPQPLIVGVASPQCLERPLTVRFSVVNTPESPSGGRVAPATIPATAPTLASVDVPLDSAGLAKCDFHLDSIHPTQQVVARLLDVGTNAVSLPLIFNANLSIASQVAYDPGTCAGLGGQTTVQTAVDRLAGQLSLYKVSGDAQTLVPGGILAPLRVQAANRCGIVLLQAGWVSFKVLSGGGTVSAATINADGTAECSWTLGPRQNTQELEAALQPVAGPTAEPRRVVFTAQRAPVAQDQDKGIHVREVRASDQVLLNDAEIQPAQLAKGLIVVLDGPVEALAIRDKPTCFVTVEVPFPLLPVEQDFWGMRELVGFQPLVLEAETAAKEDQIRWLPPGNVIVWLNRLLDRAQEMFKLSRVLARLTLKGNVIWAAGDPKTNLDGEAFGRPGAGGRVDLDLDKASGDGRRGGDFEMWFWLKKELPPIKIKAEEKVADPKLTDKVADPKVGDKVADPKLTDKVADPKVTDAKPVADAKVTDLKVSDKVAEHMMPPGATPVNPGKGGGKMKSGGKAFIRKEERPVMDLGTPKRT